MNMIFESIFLFIFCIILAFLEVQIEGKDGWASKLPTWRPAQSHWLAKWYGRFMGGKELTGYHIGMLSLVLFVLHGFYFWQYDWSLSEELQVLALFSLVSVVWDFLWFVLNPHFGWQKFSPIHVAWHSSWLGPWPYDYYFGIIAYLLLYSFSFLKDWQSGLMESVSLLLYLSLLVLATVLIRHFVDKNKN